MDIELMGILEDIAISVEAAKRNLARNDIPSVLYCVDRAEMDAMRARNLTVSIMRHGDKNE